MQHFGLFCFPSLMNKFNVLKSKKARLTKSAGFCGERGIRTPGTVHPHACLANMWFQPLTHLSSVRFMLNLPFSRKDCKYKRMPLISPNPLLKIGAIFSKLVPAFKSSLKDRKLQSQPSHSCGISWPSTAGQIPFSCRAFL